MIIHERRLTCSGAVTIPKEIRTALGIDPGDPMKIAITKDGNLTLIRRPVCHICNSNRDVVKSDNLRLCRKCLDTFNDEARGEQNVK